MNKVLQLLGDGGLVRHKHFNSGSDNAWSFMTRRADLHTYAFRLYGSGGSDALELQMLISTMQEYLHLPMDMEKELLHFNNDVLIEQTDSGSIRAHNTVPVTIGGHSGGANGANIYLSEFLIYNEVVAGLDRQIMEGYLAHKWGLASSFQQDIYTKRVLRPE